MFTQDIYLPHFAENSSIATKENDKEAYFKTLALFVLFLNKLYEAMKITKYRGYLKIHSPRPPGTLYFLYIINLKK